MICIYKITSPSGKIYIGQTWNWTKRQYNYSNLECKKQKKLYNSLKKYGWNNHKVEFLITFDETVLQTELDNQEIYWWKHYIDLGFNMLNTKYPGSRGKHSQETKKKMKNRTVSIEMRLRISNKLKGRKLPKEVCEKMSPHEASGARSRSSHDQLKQR